MKTTSALALACLLTASPAFADTLSLTALSADTQITVNNFASGNNRDGDSASGTDLTNWAATVTADTGTTLNVGRNGTNVQGIAYYVFNLGSLPVGATITSATLKLGISAAVTVALASNYDIYALTNYSGTAATTAMLYQGASSNPAADTTNTHGGAPLFDNAFAAGSTYAVGSYSFSNAGLVAYLNGQTSVTYAYFRVNQDAYNNGERITFGTSENTTTAYKPVLDITYAAIPEPSTCVALAGVAVLGLAACRRRRR